ncbi:hypothetical protein D3C83_119990 [compost metagenome]
MPAPAVFFPHPAGSAAAVGVTQIVAVPADVAQVPSVNTATPVEVELQYVAELSDVMDVLQL